MRYQEFEKQFEVSSCVLEHGVSEVPAGTVIRMSHEWTQLRQRWSVALIL